MSENDGFKWYGSRDEEYFVELDASTRDEAVEAVRAEYDSEDEADLYIVEAKKAEMMWHINGDWALEHLEDAANSADLGDPEDGLEIEATPAQVRDLGAMLSAVAKAWAEKHKIEPRVWAFGAMRNAETIPPMQLCDGEVS